MAPPKYMPIGHLCGVCVVALLYGTFVSIKMLWDFVWCGPTNYFYSKKRTRPEDLDNPEYGTHHYARLKNIRLHYVSNGPEEGELMLFLHGFPELWYSWRHQLKEFGKDYRAVAIDLRGYGESEKPDGTAEYRVEKISEDVQNFIEHLGYTKCHLVAHDWGGAVAWDFTLRHPDMVENLIICDSAHFDAVEKYAKDHILTTLQSWYMFFFQVPCLPEILMAARDGQFLKDLLSSSKLGAKNFTNDELEAYLYSFKDYADRKGPINYFRAKFRFQPEPQPTRKVNCPTLVLWGTEDAFVNKAAAVYNKEYVDGDCDMRYIEGASHWVQQDNPERVNLEMRKFLARK